MQIGFEKRYFVALSVDFSFLFSITLLLSFSRSLIHTKKDKKDKKKVYRKQTKDLPLTRISIDGWFFHSLEMKALSSNNREESRLPREMKLR